jgi:asparagine synthase (glutamine-hydrolysing)
MCGIVGMMAFRGQKADPRMIQQMTLTLRHRGPDDGAVYVSDHTGLGFRRLAILDLSQAAQQPMVSDDGNIVLVFNGEIFNYVELRHELEERGHTFRSSGDTEVLLRAYHQWGWKCVHRLNGMWAFVVYDKRRDVLVGSRDRFGIKPLYYYQHEDHFIFGSEIKAIVASGVCKRSANWNAVAEFLINNRLDEDQNTFYEGIYQLGPGAMFDISRDGRMRTWRYWTLEGCQAQETRQPAEAYAALFEDAVRLHMRSDVPVGVCLSGGLDSTSIICSVARNWNGSSQPLLAFSYNAAEFDESQYIQDTIRQTGARLKSLDTDPVRLWEGLARVLWFHDEPVHSMTALVGFELMRLAAESGVKVILNGQGSDEVIAGYPNFFMDYWYTLSVNGNLGTAWREIAEYRRSRGDSSGMLLFRAVRFLLQNRLTQFKAYQRLARKRHRWLVRHQRWFAPELSNHLRSREVWPADWSLDAALKRAVECAPLPLFLRIEDRNSMAHSVEARLPFLDFRLVSLAFNLSPNWKMRGRWNKYVLREAMRHRIPESVRARVEKMGFPVPARKWFAEALYGPVQDLLHTQQFRQRGIYNVGAVRRDLEAHRRGEMDISEKLFNLVQTELWLATGQYRAEGASESTAREVVH